MSLDRTAAPDRAGEAPAELSFADRRAILEANLTRQTEAIRAADSKLVLLVPTTTAMAGVLAALLRGAGSHGLPALYVVIAALPILFAYFFMGLTLVPRVRRDSRSLLFFGAVAGRDPAAHRADFAALTPAAYLDDLVDQCHASAAIARVKYRHVRHAYMAFFAALPFWALAIYLLSGPR
jgi:hypothetical protein